MSLSDYCLILVTIDNFEDAKSMSRHLIDNNLAACCSVSSKKLSIYKWKAVVEEQEEYEISIKTRKSLFPALEAQIKKLHNYEVPEIIMLTIEDGNKDYLNWIDESLVQSL